MTGQMAAIALGLAGAGLMGYRDYRAGEGFGWLFGSLVAFGLYMGAALVTSYS
jgi:hypothetical protein